MRLMLDQGWWLQLEAQRSPSIGFGALPQRAWVEAGLIDRDAVCALLADHVYVWESNGENAQGLHHFEVTFGADGRVYDVADDVYPQLLELFGRAFRSRDPDAQPAREADTIVRFWERAFFLRSN